MKPRICILCHQPIPFADHAAGWGYRKAIYCKRPVCLEARKELDRKKSREYSRKRRAGQASAGNKPGPGKPRYLGYRCDVCGKPIRVEYTMTGEQIIYRRKCTQHRDLEKTWLKYHNVEDELVYNVPVVTGIGMGF